MKKIEFTDRQLMITGIVFSDHDISKPVGEFLHTEFSELINLINVAYKSPNGATVSTGYTETVVTPARAFAKVDERKQAARMEEIERLNVTLKNEKEAAKEMIARLVNIIDSDAVHSIVEDVFDEAKEFLNKNI